MVINDSKRKTTIMCIETYLFVDVEDHTTIPAKNKNTKYDFSWKCSTTNKKHFFYFVHSVYMLQLNY